ncbi:MAG: S8 family serine peptidase [Flavobacteriales bacterium]|nr:S8 family serine peptidase [Flavobacteriales bacterium]
MKCFTTLLVFFYLLIVSFGQHPIYLKNHLLAPALIQSENLLFNSDQLQTDQLYIVQFADFIAFSQINKSIAGLQPLQYLSKNTYLVAISTDSLQKKKLLQAGIQFLLPFKTEYKISSLITEEHQFNGEYWIHIRPDVLLDSIQRIFKQAYPSMQILGRIDAIHGLYVKIPKHDFYSVIQSPFIYYVDIAPQKHSDENDEAKNSLRTNVLQHQNNSGLPLTGQGIRMMLNDDGDVGLHIDYKNRTDQTAATPSPAFIDHANHIAGTLIGAGNRDPRYAGMAPGAFLKVHTYTTNPSSGLALFDFPNAYVNEQITITSTSQSDGCNAGYTAFAQLMDQQITDYPSLMHVFSAGNTGNNNCGFGAGNSWGTITGGHKQAKNVISVGNVTNGDLLVGSSSRGPATDGRIKPECVAVGTNVISTTDYPEENNYVMKSGSSHACPGVAGTLALLYEGYKNLHGNNLPSSALIKAALLNTCDDLGNHGPDFQFGFGRVNARRAYQLLEQGNYWEDSIAHGQVIDTFLIVPPGTYELRVMLYWNDIPASVLSQYALVNNLDLELTNPSSLTYLPWVLNSTPNATQLQQPATRQIDTLNNVEQITVINPQPGIWNLRVSGTHIPFEKQAFVIVYEFVQNELVLTHPTGSEQWVPGEIARIRWDAYNSLSSDFQLSYSSNGGITWQFIQNNISSTQRYFDWTVPNTPSGKYLIRIEQDTLNDVSDSFFSVMPTADSLKIDSICDENILLDWPDVPNAWGYIVYKLGNFYMDSVTTTPQSQLWLTLQGPPEENWFSVSALGPNHAVSRRAYAIHAGMSIDDCYTGMAEQLNSPKPKVYPNPATSELLINGYQLTASDELLIMIHEISGRQVMVQKQPVSEQIIRLDVSSLTNGIYLLSVKHQEGITTWQFIKQ